MSNSFGTVPTHQELTEAIFRTYAQIAGYCARTDEYRQELEEAMADLAPLCVRINYGDPLTALPQATRPSHPIPKGP